MSGAARKGKDERDPCNPCYRYTKGSLIRFLLDDPKQNIR